MSAAYVQTTRALEAERPRTTALGTIVAALFLAALAVWFFESTVTVYEVSKTARIETQSTPHAIDAPIAGRIVKLELALGAAVKEGDVIIELDSEPQRRKLVEEQTRLAMLAPEIDALGRVLAARERSLQNDREATTTALEEGRARQGQAEISAGLASDELARTARLTDAGSVAEVELVRARAEAGRRRAETEALALNVVRQARDQRTRESQSFAQSEDLRRDLASLSGKQATTRATIDELTHDIEMRTIRAPVAGTIRDVSALAVGGYVKEGAKIATIVPAGGLRVVAEFPPFTSVGRVVPGQPARLRLDGYPWTQYGEVRGRVTNIATEAREGSVRVELDVIPQTSSRIPMQHGLTGSAEIEIEHVTPATLVLRTVGKLFAPDVPAPKAATVPGPTP